MKTAEQWINECKHPKNIPSHICTVGYQEIEAIQQDAWNEAIACAYFEACKWESANAASNAIATLKNSMPSPRGSLTWRK